MADRAFPIRQDPELKSGLEEFQVQTFTEDLRRFHRASFLQRLGAFFIDGLVTAAAGALVEVIAVKFLGLSEKSMLLSLYKSCLGIGYFVLTQYHSGQTLGKMALKIKTIDERTGDAPSIMQALGRESLGKFLSGITLGIGYLMALGTSRKAMHDRLFETCVVDLKRRQY